MNQWIERIKNHEFFTGLSEIEKSIERSRTAAKIDSTNFDAWERTERVTKFIQEFLSSIDPLLISPQILNNSSAALHQVAAQLGHFADNQDIAHLNEANSQIDSVLTQLGSIPRLDKGSTAKELSQASTNFRNSVGGLVKSLEKNLTVLIEEKNALQTKLQELNAEVTTQKQRADNVILQMQEQFSAAQQSRQTEAGESESKRVAEFALKQEERDQIFEGLFEKSEAMFESLNDELKNRSASFMDDLKKTKEQAEVIVGIISTEAVVHGYGKTANDEKDAANIWRWVAVIALGIWILAGLCFFGLTYDKDLSFSALARQFLISTPFALLVGFAALESSKHQRAERANRKQELEIAAIDPYLASFDEESRNGIKLTLAGKFFGQREAEPAKAEPKQMLDVSLEALMKQFKEFLITK